MERDSNRDRKKGQGSSAPQRDLFQNNNGPFIDPLLFNEMIFSNFGVKTKLIAYEAGGGGWGANKRITKTLIYLYTKAYYD